jgi:putative membrane protein
MTRYWKTWGSMAAAVLLISGSARAQEQSDTDRFQNQRNSAPANAAGDQKGFVKKMLLANMAEIQLGQMAESQASSADVKSFAQMMVAHHTQANQQLLPLAQQLGVQQPTDLDGKHKALAARLSKLHGEEFDRAFTKAMVADHQDTLKDVQRMAGDRSGASASRSGISGGAGAMGSGTSGTAGTSGSSTTGGATTSGSMTSGSTTTGGSTTGGSATTGSSDPAAGSSAMPSASAPQSPVEYAAVTLPIIQQHLQQAQQLASQIGK